MLIINILALTNIFILFTLLFFRKDNALPNKVLAFVFLIPGMFFVNSIFLLADIQQIIPFSLFFVQMIAVLFPVMLFGYFNILLGKGFGKNLVLFSGSALLFFYIIALAIRFFCLPDIEQSSYIKSLTTDNYPFDLFLYTVFFYTWQLVYFSVITVNIFRYKKKIDQNLSNLEQVQFLYINRFIFLLWFFTAILVVLYVLLPLYQVDYLFLPIFVNILYFFILYFSYHYNAIFTVATFKQLNDVNSNVNNSQTQIELDKKTFEPNEKHESIYQSIIQLLEEDKIFIELDLSIKSISKRLEEPEYMISQSINHFYQKSFFDLINEKRIDASKQRLNDIKPNETIEGIAFECGFNTRSSFYRAFKKYTGKTPQQFIKPTKNSI